MQTFGKEKDWCCRCDCMYFGVCVVCDVTYFEVCKHKTCPHCCLLCWYVTRKPRVFEIPRTNLVDCFYNLNVSDESMLTGLRVSPLESADTPASQTSEDYYVNEAETSSDLETRYDFVNVIGHHFFDEL